jgi:flagellar motility protein MotE (MotC chaperone)
MTRSRLLPALLVAAAVLLTLKGASFISGEGSAFAQTGEGQAPAADLPLLDPSRSADSLAASLAARATELDMRESELDFRENLIAAAEASLDERASALEALEGTQAAEGGEAAAAAATLDVIGVFALMNPRDAAAVFDALVADDLTVLLDVVTAMDARKVAPIIEEMMPASATALTAALMRPGAGGGTQGGFDASMLPQIGPAQ